MSKTKKSRKFSPTPSSEIRLLARKPYNSNVPIEIRTYEQELPGSSRLVARNPSRSKSPIMVSLYQQEPENDFMETKNLKMDNENKLLFSTKIETWISQIENSNLENLHNYIKVAFVFLRDINKTDADVMDKTITKNILDTNRQIKKYVEENMDPADINMLNAMNKMHKRFGGKTRKAHKKRGTHKKQ
jgi:hypothetical protein